MKVFVNATIGVCLLSLATAGATETVPFRTSDLLAPMATVSHALLAGMDDENKTFLDMSQQDEPEKTISLKKAMLLSILLPGAGQYYADAKFKGQVFMGVEAAIWTGFIAYRVYGGWKEDDYRAYAAAHAGIDNANKDDQFYDWLGFYDSREEFNQIGRLYYPDRPYVPDNSSSDWQWDSAENRVRYKELKAAAKTAFRNSTLLIGLALANRVIAGIDTYRTVKSAQARIKSLTQVGEYRFTMSPKLLGSNPRIQLSISRRF